MKRFKSILTHHNGRRAAPFPVPPIQCRPLLDCQILRSFGGTIKSSVCQNNRFPWTLGFRGRFDPLFKGTGVNRRPGNARKCCTLFQDPKFLMVSINKVGYQRKTGFLPRIGKFSHYTLNTIGFMGKTITTCTTYQCITFINKLHIFSYKFKNIY